MARLTSALRLLAATPAKSSILSINKHDHENQQNHFSVPPALAAQAGRKTGQEGKSDHE